MKAAAVLLVQPPIYDFTAFDLYLYPLALVHVGQALLERGYRVRIVDALDRFAPLPGPLPGRPGLKKATFRADGCGHFVRERIDPPRALEEFPRRFHRFGLPRDLLQKRLLEGEKPALAALTCTMTYWYPGVIETVETIRSLWPGIPVVLGGVYATLCPEHAAGRCGVDLVVKGGDLSPLFDLLPEAPAVDPPPAPFAAHGLVGARASAALSTSKGCPRRCPYCASFLLNGPYRRRGTDAVLDEIDHLLEAEGQSRIAFYDDALLAKEEEFLKLAEGIQARGFHRKASFHCPNGIEARGITRETAAAMRACNFRTLRIGFETADPKRQSELGNKASRQDLEQAVGCLSRAGFPLEEVGVYLLAGLPGQEEEEIADSLRFVHGLGARGHLASFAPVPGTPLFDEAAKHSRLDLAEPLFHNKTLAPYRFDSLGENAFRRLKDLARNLNEKLS